MFKLRHFPAAPFVLRDRLLRRVDDNDAAVAVKDYERIRQDMRGHILQSDNGRDLQRTGKERRMGCYSPRIGGVTEYFVAAEKNSVCRRQRLRNHDGPSFEPRDQLLFLDIPDDAVFDIFDVVCPLAHILIR